MGRSMLLKIGVYTVSQPGGVWKFVAARNVTAPGGVPRSSGTTNFRMSSSASSRDIFRSLFRNSTSCITMPMPPTGSAVRTVKIGTRSPFLEP
jgi:hypothetical protein